MQHSKGLSGLFTSRCAAAIAGLFAAIAFAFAGTGKADAATGDPFAVDFNHAGLYVGVETGGDLDDIVLSPETTNSEGDPLGPLEIRGEYTSDTGEFVVPKDTGFKFPTITIPIRGIDIAGDLAIAEDATGNYDAATGEMALDMEMTLTLSLPEISVLPEPIGSLGSGPLECRFGPMSLNLTTDPVNWPAPGKAFEDAAAITEGAIAGSWDLKPKATAISGGSVCTILAGMLDAIGGVYLADSATPIAEMPTPTGNKPVGRACPAGTTGKPGTHPEDCKPDVPKPPVCPTGTTGTYPNCLTPPVPTERAEITKVVITPAKAKLKAGKAVKLKVKVTNTGNAAATGLALSFRSSNKRVKAPKKATITVAAGATVTKTFTVKATKLAKGKATITANAGGRQGKSVLTIAKARKKK